MNENMNEFNSNDIEILKAGINSDYDVIVKDILNEEQKKIPDHEKLILGKTIANLAMVLDNLDKNIIIKRCITLETKVRNKDKEIEYLRDAIKQMKIHGCTNRNVRVNKPGEVARRGRPEKIVNPEWTQNLIDGGMSIQEIASVFDMSIYTLRREIKKLYLAGKITVKPEQFKHLGVRNL